MSNFVIALLIAASATAWLYNKFMRRSGSNTQQSVIAAGVIGVVVLIIVWGTLNLVL